MDIRILYVGKIREKAFQGAIDEYAKRLSRYCRLSFFSVADEKTPDGASVVMEDSIRAKEGERLLSLIRERDYVIALDLKGEALDSPSLAARLDELSVRGHSSLAFVIGGSLGLSGRVLDRADWRLSFSKLTFPHQLMQVILLEQIYRCFRIIKGEPYHK